MRITDLNKVWQLSRRERGLLFQSVLLLPALHAALLILGYSRLRGVMERLLPLRAIDNSPSETENIKRAREIARIVSVAARHGFYKATCLRRSLLVWWFLRGQGIQSQIRFGVRKINLQMEAHAWVAYQGTILNDSEHICEAYQPLEEVYPPTKLGL